MNAGSQMIDHFYQSKQCVVDGNINGALNNLGCFLKAGAGSLRQSFSINQTAKLKRLLEYWLSVYKTIKKEGITDTVKEAFGLRGDNNTSSVFAATSNFVATSQGWAADVFENNKKSVVIIYATDEKFDYIEQGSGFIVSKDGYVLKNDHVVFNEQKHCYHNDITMVLFNGENNICLKLIDSDPQRDVALLRFEPDAVSEITAVTRISNYDALQQGADVMLVGNGFNLGIAPILGMVRYARSSTNGDLVYTIPSNAGDSGAPVFNRFGEVIGIHKSTTNSIRGQEARAISNATPMDEIEELVKKWERKHKITVF